MVSLETGTLDFVVPILEVVFLVCGATMFVLLGNCGGGGVFDVSSVSFHGEHAPDLG